MARCLKGASKGGLLKTLWARNWPRPMQRFHRSVIVPSDVGLETPWTIVVTPVISTINHRIQPLSLGNWTRTRLGAPSCKWWWKKPCPCSDPEPSQALPGFAGRWWGRIFWSVPRCPERLAGRHPPSRLVKCFSFGWNGHVGPCQTWWVESFSRCVSLV